MDSTTTTAQPLADRSTNTHLQPSTEKLNDLKSAPANMTSLEYHRQVLHGKLENGEKYVPTCLTMSWGQGERAVTNSSIFD